MHSHYSRATSNRMDIENIEKYGKLKGLNLIGTGDFTHPKWLGEMKDVMKEVSGTGFYQHKDNKIFFMLTGEISLIYHSSPDVSSTGSFQIMPSELFANIISPMGDLKPVSLPVLFVAQINQRLLLNPTISTVQSFLKPVLFE